MTVVVALVDPPRAGLVLPDLVDSTPLTAGDATRLYEAFVRDLARAAADSGGDLLLNYRPEALLPEEHRTGEDPRDAVETLAADALSDAELEEARVEVQVGSTPSARLGNTVSHLLDEDAVDTVTVCDPAAPLRSRQHIDSIAMKLRRSPVVLAPGARGRVSTAAFVDTIDFDGALTDPALTIIAERAHDADHAVDFAPQQTVVETHDDLVGVLAEIRARQSAGRWTPPHTTQVVDDLGLGLASSDDDLRVVTAD
jgi:hypothetical protein